VETKKAARRTGGREGGEEGGGEEEEMASEDIDMVTGPSGEGSSAGASSIAGAKGPKRLEIKKWNAVALWAWGMHS